MILEEIRWKLSSSNLLQMTFTGLEHTCGIELGTVLINSGYPSIFVNKKGTVLQNLSADELRFLITIKLHGSGGSFQSKKHLQHQYYRLPNLKTHIV